MNNITRNVFIGTEKPVVLADLQEIEILYKISLPADYKEHILTYNGGWPQNENTFLQVLEGGQQVARVLSDMK